MPLGILRARKEGEDIVYRVQGTGPARQIESIRRDGWGAMAELQDGLYVEFDPSPTDQAQDVRRYAPVPAATRNLLAVYGCDHPGLVLDRFAYRYAEQDHAKPVLEKVASTRPRVDGDPGWFDDLSARRLEALTALPGFSGKGQFALTSAAPLAVHLARSSALENAGICLHPVHGFAYLPGTGLKGLAHAYACRNWLPSVAPTDRQQAFETICGVFGAAPSPWLNDLAKRLGVRTDQQSKAGCAIFHDAWPTSWPELIVDIVNCHHSEYYAGSDAPGDWEDPVPVYFLAVSPRTPFSFALSARRDDIPEDGYAHQHPLDLARQWLLGGLAHLGFGAKTNSGYGYFAPSEGLSAAPKESDTLKVLRVDLELVAPAFLAGARQQRADCDLRPATLRGHLRWWWRTMHAGSATPDELRRMEALLWGDTASNGAVSLRVVPDPTSPPSPHPVTFKQTGWTREHRETLVPNESFVKKHNLRPPPTRRSYGVLYASFGMDEMKVGDPSSRKTRFVVDAGARWKLIVTARPSCFMTSPAGGRHARTGIGAASVLEQARCAVWLLCHFGAVGAKSRHGFGSFADPVAPNEVLGLTFQGCLDAGAKFRAECGLQDQPSDPCGADSASLRDMQDLSKAAGLPNPWLESANNWPSPWTALDELGAAAQSFAQAPASSGHGSHCDSKLALGLPRKIDRNPSRELVGYKGCRYASPVIYHVGRDTNGRLVNRVSAFPAKHLRFPTMTEAQGRTLSQRIQIELLKHLQATLPPPPPPIKPPPPPTDSNLLEAEGVVTSKKTPTSREAEVKLVTPLPDGQDIIQIGGAKSLKVGDPVKVTRKSVNDRWERRS